MGDGKFEFLMGNGQDKFDLSWTKLFRGILTLRSEELIRDRINIWVSRHQLEPILEPELNFFDGKR